ncbi:MAG: polyprenyl synthetase family protein [Haliangium ochraceum]
MSASPRFSTAAEPTLAALVDDALGARLETVAHPEDWPEPEPSALHEIPRPLWDHAIGDVARDILGRPSRQFRARLCELAWCLVDGQGQVPSSLPAIVEILHAGSLIVDDIEDGSARRRGGPALHIAHGVPRALNTGNWMYFWALALVDDVPVLRASIRDDLRRALARTLYNCHLGQALDLSIPIGRVPRPWVYRTVATCTMLKTGALMELAARMGAIAAGAAPARVEALSRFGRRLGLGLQMLDDFGNLTAPVAETVDSKALEDLRGERPTWPWALASRELDAPAFAELQADVRALVDGGDGDGTRARALAAKLRMAVGLKGRRQAASYLRGALADLQAGVGDRAELALMSREIERLESSYG